MNVAVPPGFAAFRSAYQDGRGSLAWRRGVADLETPVAAFLKLAHGKPNAFLLESVEGGGCAGATRSSGWTPTWSGAVATDAPRSTGTRTRRRTRSARGAAGAGQPARGDRRDAAGCAGLSPPMSGGLVGYLGYTWFG